MPRITIDYDSDSDFERDHLELATHQQILTRYLSVKNDKKLPPKEKTIKLEHASEKAFLALKRAEIMLEKANEQIAGLKERMEFEGTDAGLRQQLNFEREKDTNRELKRELLVYEGVLPPYLETQGTSWINEKRMKWTRENRELRELRDAELQLDALALTELSPSEKIEREITRLKEQNTKMNAYLEQNQIVHTMLNAPTPSHIVKLAEENMVLKAKWEKNWELTAAKREKQKNTEDDATRKEKELQSENFETWKERKDQEAQPQYQARQGRRWRKRDRDDDFELSDVECVMVTRRRRRLSSSS